MNDMPRPRPPHLHCERTRHGKLVWVVRIGHGPRTRIRGVYGNPDFWARYDAAINGTPLPGKVEPKARSLAWLIARYKNPGTGSAAWFSLSPGTRKQRESIFRRVIASAGNDPYSSISRKTIIAGRDRRKPNAARHFVQAMRGLFKWAVDVELATSDPTEGVEVKRPQTDGFAIWPEQWCLAYEARWPLGTRERVWYEVIHCTGLRRGDAVRVGRQHVKEVLVRDDLGNEHTQRRGTIRAEKNGETAYFIVTDRLQEALDAGPTGDLAWIVGERGTPLAKESFGNYFREACKSAGVPGSAHGIRKTRATIEAESGASGARLDALFGWKTGSNTSAIYIRKANRAKLAFGPDDEPNANSYSRTLLAGAGKIEKS